MQSNGQCRQAQALPPLVPQGRQAQSPCPVTQARLFCGGVAPSSAGGRPRAASSGVSGSTDAGPVHPHCKLQDSTATFDFKVKIFRLLATHCGQVWFAPSG